MTDPLDLVHLRTLVEIADCGGFHRAAAALHLSQSTVSQHVRALEKVFREPLVHKAGRGTAFTPTGDALLVEARRILAVHDQALQRLGIATDPVIMLGCTEHAADQMLPGLLSALRAAFPNRVLRFRIARSTVLEEAVSRGVLDLAIVLASGQPSGTQVGQLRLSWYAGIGAELPSVAVAPTGAGAGEQDQPWPVVAFEEPCGLRQRALQALHEQGRSAVIAAESGSLEGVVAAVRAGIGVALLPGTGRLPDGLRVVEELPDLGSIGLRVVARRGVDRELEQAVCLVGHSFLAGVTVLRSVPA
jgi:DNA-binding transcriptional LysR family regulator